MGSSNVDFDLNSLSRDQLITQVKALRAAVRAHREQMKNEAEWPEVNVALWSLLPKWSDPLPERPGSGGGTAT